MDKLFVLGEFFPDLAQSRKTRVLSLNVEETDVKEKELKYIQDHQKELQNTTIGFIKYKIENDEKIKAIIPQIYTEKFNEAREKMKDRTAEMLAGLYVGYYFLMDFALINGAIAESKKNEMLQEGWETLIEVGKSQSKNWEDTDPMNMTLSAITILTNTGKLAVFDYDSTKYAKYNDITKSDVIGYCKNEEGIEINLVYQDKLFMAINKFYENQGIVYPWKKATMARELWKRGYLYSAPKQERPQISRQNPRNKKEEQFIGLLQDKIYMTCYYIHNGDIFTK